MLGAVGTKKTTAASIEKKKKKISQDVLLGTKGRPTGRLEEMLLIERRRGPSTTRVSERLQ